MPTPLNDFQTAKLLQQVGDGSYGIIGRIEALPPDFRIHRAFGARPVAEGYEAPVAEDAFGDLINPAFFGFGGPHGVCDQGP